MKKILFPITLLIAIVALAGCRPVSSRPEEHEHTAKTTWSFDTTSHWHDCIADDGYKFNVGNHTFAETIVEPTYEHGGYTKYTCSVCGYTYNDNNTDPLVHNYEDSWTHNETTHWHACTDAGYEDLKQGEADHTFTDSVVEPTYETQGYTLHTCSVCGYNYKDNYVDPLEHHYSSDWTHNETTHWHACTDQGYEELKGDEANHTFTDVVVDPTLDEYGYTEHTCNVCGYSFKDTYVDPTGEHHYSSEWNYDEETHWHDCTDPGCSSKSGVAAHTYEETARQDATYEAAGYIEYTCNVCGRTYQEELPQLVHHYSSDWTHNETKHWHACTDAGYEELKQDEADHTFTDSVVEPTYETQGYTLHTCSVCGYSYMDTYVDPLEHHYSSEWTHNETTHWHACTDQGYEELKQGEAPHSFGDPEFVDEHDYMNYKKGKNVSSCECGYEIEEVVYYTRSEMLQLMNEFISGKDYFDIFEIREDLIKNNYPIVDDDEVEDYYGYDLVDKAITTYSATNATNFVSFKEIEVNNLSELENALASISNSVVNYSTIKLMADLVTSEPILIEFTNPVHLDLNNHTIDYQTESGSAVKITRHINDLPTVVITNGTIQTPILSGFNMEQTPKCVYFEGGALLRLTSVNLVNRAERGYAYADYPDSHSEAKVKINNSSIFSVVVGVCIQTNNNIIKDNTIAGSVIINGGQTLIKHNVINTSHLLTNLDTNDLDFVENAMFVSVCRDVYVTETAVDAIYDKYMMSSVDSILIYDRRSTLGTYVLKSVTIEENELTCKTCDQGAIGFGIRYIDLNFDPTQTSNHLQDIHIMDDNIYHSLVGNDPFNIRGGYSLYEVNSL